MSMGWSKAAAALVAASVVSCGGGPALAQLRVVTWNISNYAGTDRGADIQTAVYASFSGRSMSPDVIAAQEFISASALSTFVAVLNSAPGSPGDWAAAPFIDGADTESVLVYRTSRVQLLATHTVAIGSSDTNNQPRNTYRYDLRPVGYTSAPSSLAIYNVHLKAQGGTNSAGRRLIECQRIRTNAEGVADIAPGLPAGYHFMLAGDTNIQTSSVAEYQELVGSQANNAGRLFDPINSPASWNNNCTYRYIHTQEPNGTPAGGMDDRHDQLLVSTGLRDGVGLDYIGSSSLAYSLSTWNDPNHSYRSWGNDGTTCNLGIATTSNTMVGPAIAQALKNCATTSGGHLPVFLDMRVPAEVTSPTVINFGSVPQGSTAQASLTVSNDGNVVLWTANGISALSSTLVASSGFTAPAGTFNDAAGGGSNSHTITMNTSTPGVKNGTITINSSAPDQPARVVTLSGTVTAPNQSPVANAGPDQSVTDSDNSGGELVMLDGTLSNDPDGSITQYSWTEGVNLLSQGASSTTTVSLGVGFHTITLQVTDNALAIDTDTVTIEVLAGQSCGTADFDGDGDSGTDLDIEAFFACLGGDCCATCGSADFDADGDSGTDLDIEAFFRVLGGGDC